jgi:hypothetical protein
MRKTSREIRRLAETTFGHWAEVPEYPVRDWQDAVAEGSTRLGYWDWVPAAILERIIADWEVTQ